MNMRVSKVISCILFVFAFSAFLSADLSAWDSAGALTHRQMTTDALPLLSSSEYPDIAKYSTNLINYSADETYSHGGNYLANGGDPQYLWDKKVLDQYKIGDYADAYDYIGSILHLVQDQGVPAHAFDIQHVSYWAWGGPKFGDDLEKYADDAGRYSHGTILPKSGDDQIAFYADMISRTINVVNTNAVSPPTGENWSEYWEAGNYGPRRFPYDRNVNWYVVHHDNLVNNRITESINYVAGNMAAASMKLPPLIKDLKITSDCGTVPTIGKQTSAQISFKILENRKKTVKIFITVDSPTGEAIISSEYGTGKSYDLSSGSDLPWEGTYTINWDGKLANGQYPPDGEHTLSVKVQDEDGNESEILQQQFAVDTAPPTISISGASNGATYYMPVSLTITYLVIDDKDPNPTVTANYPSGTVFDSEGSYAVVVKGKDSQCEVTSHFCEKVSLDKWQMLCDNCDNCNVHPKLL